MSRKILLYISVPLLFACAQSETKAQDSILASHIASFFAKIHLSNNSLYQLPHQFIEPHSENILLDSTVKLTNGKDFSLDYRTGSITLFVVPKDSLTHVLFITYRALPFHFRDEYFHKQLIFRKDTSQHKTIGEARRETDVDKRFSLDNLFGDNLQKSGTIARGFTVGTNRDFSLQSEFQLQMNGNLTDDISLVAALSDNNIPIQPEGNTQTLSEIDKVYIELHHPNFEVTFGDFDLINTNSEFGSLQRKLQGVKGVVKNISSAKDSITVAAAISRGKFTTNEFPGFEGVQGPYRLYGKNNERTIIIIAGSERVYVNGETMVRGNANDYTIDYSSGELTFTSRRLITSSSRIVTDFEYSDRQYSRNSFAVHTSNNLFEDALKVQLNYFREGDDENTPIDANLTVSDKELLRNAGANRSLASQAGWREDSLGNYVRDSLISNGVSQYIFKYKPDTLGIKKYSVTFTFTGAGSGDYERKSIGVFEYVGKNLGSYLPQIFLPLPELRQIGVAQANLHITDSLTVATEFAGSAFDANRFSLLDDNNSNGNAYNLRLYYASPEIKNIGSFSLNAKQRFVDARFTPMDRTNDVDFNRIWNTTNNAQQNDERISEGNVFYRPSESININFNAGNLERGSLSSVREQGMLSFQKENLPSLSYSAENIDRNEQSTSKSSWFRQKAITEFRLMTQTNEIFIPGFRFENEMKKDFDSLHTYLAGTSFRLYEFAPKLSVKQFLGTEITGELQIHNEDSVATQAFVNASQTITQLYELNLYNIQNFSSTFDVTLRNKNFTNDFEIRGNRDVSTNLFRWFGRYATPGQALQTDWLYEAATERASRIERVFIKVTKGTGNYIYIGDRNNNGIQDDADFDLTRFDGDYILTTLPSDALFPVINLRSNLRIKLSPAKLFPAGNENVLTHISTESFFRIEEKNSTPTPSDIYFLKFSKFLNDSTLSGNQSMTHDLLWNENENDFSLRFRFQQRKSLTQLSTTIERGYNRERSLRLRIQLDPEIANETNIINTNDNLSSTVASDRVRSINGNTFTTDFSYRPKQQFEFGFKIETTENTNRTLLLLTADINTEASRFTYSFQGRGQLRLELSREEVQLSKNIFTFPYQLTNGKVNGISWLWKIGYDYQITQHLQSSASYDGRKEATRDVIHTARAELRAIF